MNKSPFFLASLLLFPVLPARAASVPIQKEVILSPVYKIDRKFKSMEGPQSTQSVYLVKDEKPELLWITGFKTEMVQADGVTPALPEFMCHVNLDLDVGKHASLFKESSNNSRILTLSQGQLSVKFPKGYGMPILSTEALSMTTQVLNFNEEHPNMDVRHKVTFEFVRDVDLKKPMKPLFNTNGFGMKMLQGTTGRFGESGMNDVHHGASCLPGAPAPNAAGGSVYNDALAQKFTGHWVVKPGREVNHTNITRIMNLPYDTTLHYAAVHLHPFAESLELRDITANKRVFRSHARGYQNKIGLSFVDSFSSKRGVKLYKDHEYELVSTYNNTTQTDQDSMAVMLLFLLDKQFKKPDLSAPPPAAVPAAPQLPVYPPVDPSTLQPAKERATLHTPKGDIVLKFYPSIAPQTVAQIIALIRAGDFDTTHFVRVEPGFVIQTSNVYDRTVPLSDAQRKLIHPLPAEFNGVHHRRGILSMAREDNNINSGESSFSILLGDAPHLDSKYTVFGEVESGMDVVAAIEKTPISPDHRPLQRMTIRKAEIKTQK